jgi:hypothetical protein
MHRTPDNGIVFGPYGGIGYVERHKPIRPAGRFSLWCFVRRCLSLMA